ncbi:complexin-3-like [Pangasianodon hypophthalmus]|uniref:complexin-3-like n=1 Tax=Pangasianodon hypophthalmus TaxID=310915 RepID=UPI002307549A|nr:complexin-3-like [Pangasianodon hypophthalmus]
MEAVMMKSLLAPFRKFTSYITETLQKDIWGSEGQRSKLMDHNPNVPRAYQSEQERERKLREARNMEKNAERAAMRAHFRRKYQLPTNAEDSRRVRAAVGKVVIPRHLTKMVQSETAQKEKSGLLSVFQNLSFSADFTHKTQRNTQYTKAKCT